MRRAAALLCVLLSCGLPVVGCVVEQHLGHRADGAIADAGADASSPADGGGPEAGLDAGRDCEQSPCRLVGAQCGCDESQACEYRAEGRFCRPEGTEMEGEQCELGGCRAGLTCLLLEGSGLRHCYRYCDSDSDCPAPGSRCLDNITDPGGAPEVIKACTLGCAFLTGDGCADPTSCVAFAEMTGHYTRCLLAGTGAHGTPCVDYRDCAEGTRCTRLIPSARRECLSWCVIGDGSRCLPGTECTSFGDAPFTLGTVEYGVCL